MKPLTIGQVARRAGVGVETIRFYERSGLIAKPPRRSSGYREYSEDVISRIRFIRRAKELGFTLKEIRELLSLRLASDTTCGNIKERADAKIADIEGKIKILRRMRRSLTALTAACKAGGPLSECPILDALDKEDDK